jgi:feruloyl esterase
VIFSRYEPGGELLYATGLVGPAPFQISTDFFKYFILK